MASIIATVDIKGRIIGVDSENTRKQLSQRFDKFRVQTQVIEDWEWWMRSFFAYMILKYGPDVDDWIIDEEIPFFAD